MFKNLFSRRKNEGKGGGANCPTPKNKDAIPNDEYELPSLHRADFSMTPELLRRKEVEALQRKYNVAPYKSGGFI